MSETSKKTSVDALLRAWPDVEKSPSEWDEAADAIVTRVRSGEVGGAAAYTSDEELLSPPLGQEEKQGHNSASPVELSNEGSKMTMADRERDRRSLQDLVKMAQTGLTPPPSTSAPSGVQRAGEAKADDSGLIDLRAAVASGPGGAARASSTPLASQGLFDDEPASIRPPVSSHLAHQPAPSIPPPPSSMAPASMAPPSAAQQMSFAPPQPLLAQQVAAPKRSGGGAIIALVIGGVVALGAAAAGTFFYLRTHAPAPATVAATETPAADVAPSDPAAAAPADEAASADEDSNAEATLDPDSLPTATPDSNVAAAPKTRRSGAARASAPKAEAPKAEAKLTEKDLPSSQPGEGGDLSKAIAGAVGPQEKKEKEAVPAAGSNLPAGNIPQKPSQGAVTGAIGAVLSGARACLGPDDPVSHATLTFGSDGTVQSVRLSGFAAGKPAEGCIKGALSKAKVGAFAEPSYTTRVTVRHP